MAKKLIPPTRTTPLRSSICLPIGMKAALDNAITTQGGSLKRRSSWIAAACEDLLANPQHEELIQEEFFDGKTLTLPLVLDSALVNRIAALAERMTSQKRIYDRSSVIRTAITQGVLAATGYQLRSVPLGDRGVEE